MAYDAGSIESTLDVDVRPFRRGLEQAKRDAREFEQRKVSPVVDLDDRRAREKILSIDAQLRRVAGVKATATVAVEHGQALRKLIDTSDRLDRLRNDLTTARVDADTDAARRRLDTLDIQLRRIGLITSRPKVTVDGVERANLQLDALALRLAAVGDGGGGGGVPGGGRGGAGGGWLSRFARSGGPNPGWLGLGVGAALPLVPGAAGLALGAGASLFTPAVAGTLGLAGFGLAAKGSIKTVQTDVTKLNKLVAQYNAATTNKQRAAVLAKEQLLWKSLDPAQRQAVKNVQGLDAMWVRFQKRLEPQSFGALAGGAKVANTGLGLLLPSSRAAGNSIIGLERSTNRDLQSPFSRYLARDVLPGETQRAIQSGGAALQNTVAGLGHMLAAFTPLGADFEQWLVRVSDRFEHWSEGSGPSRFVYWVEKEGPLAAKALTGLAHGLEGLGKGFAPIARVELAALTPTLNFIGDLGKEHPEVITAVGTALLVVGGGLKAIALAKGAAGVLTAVTGLGRGGRGGGVLGGILGSASAPGSSPAHPAYVVVLDGAGGGPTLPGGGGTSGGDGKPGPKSKVRTGLGGLLGVAAGALGLSNIIGNQMSLPSNASPKDRALNAIGSAMVFGTQHGELGPKVPVQPRSALVGDRPISAAGNAKSRGITGVVYLGNVPGVTNPRLTNAQKFANIAATGPAGMAAIQRQLAQVSAARVGASGPALQALTALEKQLQEALDKASRAGDQYAGKIRHLAPVEAAAARATATHTEKVQRQWQALGLAPHYVGLAEAAALAGGRRIGTAVSVGMSQGIDNGFKMHVLRAVTKMADGSIKVVATKFELGSPSKLFRRYGRWSGQGLGMGFLDSIPGIQAAFAKGAAAGVKAVRASLASRLASAQQQRTADRSARSQFASNLAGQYVGGLNLAGAVGPSGNVGNLSAYIGNYAGSLKKLGVDEKRLRAKHLSPGLLDMIAQAAAAGGPAQGIALAESILSGHSGSINSLNRNFAAVGTYANRAAGQDATAQYAATLAKDDEMIQLLNKLVTFAEKNPKAVAAAFDTTVRGARTHGR